MKRILTVFTFGLFIAGNSLALAQDHKSQRVLFLGNSVFNHGGGVHQTFEKFCKTSGLAMEAVSQSRKQENPHGVEFLDYSRIPVNLPAMAADEKIHALNQVGEL